MNGNEGKSGVLVGVKVKVLVAQLCLTLCKLMDCSLPGSSVHGISPGKNNWSGLPFPSPGDLPHPVIEPMTLRSPVQSVYI